MNKPHQLNLIFIVSLIVTWAGCGEPACKGHEAVAIHFVESVYEGQWEEVAKASTVAGRKYLNELSWATSPLPTIRYDVKPAGKCTGQSLDTAFLIINGRPVGLPLQTDSNVIRVDVDDALMLALMANEIPIRATVAEHYRFYLERLPAARAWLAIPDTCHTAESAQTLGNIFADDGEKIKAEKYLRLALSLGQMEATRDLASLYYDLGLMRDSLDYFKRIGNAGNAVALRIVGEMYFPGAGGSSYSELSDHFMDSALCYYNRAADLGSTLAIANLGQMFQSGRYVKLDQARAVQYFKRGAELDETNCMVFLGRAYLLGHGVPTSLDSGLFWMKKAGELGNGNAYYEIGQLLESGGLGAVDVEQAKQFYHKGWDLGNASCMLRLSALEGAIPNRERKRKGFAVSGS